MAKGKKKHGIEQEHFFSRKREKEKKSPNFSPFFLFNAKCFSNPAVDIPLFHLAKGCAAY